MEFNYFNRKSVFCALIAGIQLLSCSCSKKETKEDIVKASGITLSNNYFGTMDKENNEYSFSLADCGNYKIRMSPTASNLLLDDTLPTGIIIKSTATKESEIYKEVDYVKSLITEYNINYPIILDLDILNNVTQNIEVTKILANIFYNKLDANNAYVCIMGCKDILNSINDISLEHKILVLNNEKLNSDELYNMVYINDEVLVSNIKYDKIIQRYKFNSPTYLLDDFKYNLNKGDTMWDLATTYNINDQILINYNDISNPTDISIGTEIIFPNIYKEEDKKNAINKTKKKR